MSLLESTYDTIKNNNHRGGNLLFERIKRIIINGAGETRSNKAKA